MDSLRSMLGAGDLACRYHSVEYWVTRLLDYDQSVLSVMEDSGIGPEGAMALADALSQNRNCIPSTLNIGHGNAIGPDGMTALAKVLATSSSIKRLSIGQNEIGPEGAASIAAALSESNSITTIWLGFNNIRLAGAAAIAEGLLMNHSLEGISILDSSIELAGERLLAEAIKRSPAIISSFSGTFELKKFAATVYGLGESASNMSNITILDAIGQKKRCFARRLPALWLSAAHPSSHRVLPMASTAANPQNLMFRLPPDLSRKITGFI